MLQGDAITMIALGVSNDTPPNAIQPKLLDGIHLRASFERDRGFPWFGFYLFRRESRAAEPVCMSGFTTAVAQGPLGSNALDTPFARFTSDANLVATDDFPSSGRIELDLQGRNWLRAELKEPAWRGPTSLGFRGTATTREEIINLGLGLPQGFALSNPLNALTGGLGFES